MPEEITGFVVTREMFDESKIRRHKKGDKRGGQFAKKVGVVSVITKSIPDGAFDTGKLVQHKKSGELGEIVGRPKGKEGAETVRVSWEAEGKSDSDVPVADLTPKEAGGGTRGEKAGERRTVEPVEDTDGAIDVHGDVELAAKLLGEGKKVKLEQPDQVCTLLDKLAKVVKEMEEAGEKAPNYDLCNVTVKGSNLFCAESKGIPRVQMPQLKGVPEKGSKADTRERDERGEVDLNAEFRKYLETKLGAKVEDKTVPASHIRATQNELDGKKVAGILGAIRDNKLADERLFTARGNYVVDGHHRWAAQVGYDSEDNKLGDVTMDVAEIDLDIITVLDEANKFAARWGLPQVGVHAGAKFADADCGCLKNLR